LKKAIVIGAGFAGMSAASFLAKQGWAVTVLEKHNIPGGRARQLKESGFSFDMGPSWYWMPDVFERYFNSFGSRPSDFYELKRLDPSYRIYWKDSVDDIPALYDDLRTYFESIEKGSANRLDQFLAEASYKYEVGINKLVYKPGLSVKEYLDWGLAKGILRLDVFSSMKDHVAKFFSDPRLRQLMEFPVLFLGATAEKIPALYSLMNYADIKLGTWYPKGGMYSVVEAMYSLALELGVQFEFDQDVESICFEKNKITSVTTSGGSTFEADVIVAGADYHFVEEKLLPAHLRSYSEIYWDKRQLAPSCLIYYVGLKKKLDNVRHHNLFFDTDFEKHGNEIYTEPQWPGAPLFYVCVPSVTDDSVAPEGCENLFFLVPVAAGLQGDDEKLRDNYFEMIIERFGQRIGQSISNDIVFKKSYSVSDFVHDYNAFKGNAYGLANTLKQTGVLKPSLKSTKVSNLYYTGQLTVPGPGVPPSLISGEIVAKEICRQFQSHKKQLTYDQDVL